MSHKFIFGVVCLCVFTIATLIDPYFGSIANVWLFHINPARHGQGLERIRWQYVASIIMFVSLLLNGKRQPIAASRPQIKIMWLFCLLSVTTCIWAHDSAVAWEQSVELFKKVFFVWMTVHVVDSKKRLEYLMWAIIMGVAYTSVMGTLGVKYDLISVRKTLISTGGTGVHLVIFLPVLLVFLMKGKKWEQITAFLIIPHTLNWVASSEQRSNFLNAVVTCALFVWLCPRQLLKRAISTLALWVFIFIVVLAHKPGYWQRMATILDPKSESSAASRFVINEGSWNMLKDHPLGVGFGNYEVVSPKYLPDYILNRSKTGGRSAHNSYFDVACGTGFLGMFLWLMMLCGSWIDLRNQRRRMKSAQDYNDRLALIALGLEIGMAGVLLGIATHTYSDLDSIYWLVGLSAIVQNLAIKESQHINRGSGLASDPR